MSKIGQWGKTRYNVNVPYEGNINVATCMAGSGWAGEGDRRRVISNRYFVSSLNARPRNITRLANATADAWTRCKF